MNWFTALDGRIEMVMVDGTRPWPVAEEITAARARGEPGCQVWVATSPHVKRFAGVGLTPDEALRSFEEKMMLPRPGSGAVS